MATIVVEDGSQVAGANSYVSEAELATYAADRGVAITGTPAELLIRAMDYIEVQPFVGGKYAEVQPLQWPRYGSYIDGFYVDSETIPARLKEAQMEVALAVDAGNDPLATVDRVTLRETVGPVSVEYMSGARETARLTAVEAKIAPLLRSGLGTAQVIRG